MITIGTRGSDLALTQTKFVESLLNEKGLQTQQKIVVTRGDEDGRPFTQLQGDGFFTKELEQRLLHHEIDLAVHSAKDLPSMVHSDIPWKAVGSRESEFDILVGRPELIDQIQRDPGEVQFRIGTSSPRRRAQVEIQFPKAEILELRGNVPSRVEKCVRGDVDAIILSEAGLNRLSHLNLLQRYGFKSLRLDWATAPCQGILGLQGHVGQLRTLDGIANDNLEAIAKAEKSVLSFLGGGCHLPLGAIIRDLKPDSKESRFSHQQAEYGLKIFYKTPQTTHQFELKNDGLGALLRNCFSRLAHSPATGQRVWLTGPLQHQLLPSLRLSMDGLRPVAWPLLEILPTWSPLDIDDFVEHFLKWDALAFGSEFGAQIFLSEVWPKLHKRLQNSDHDLRIFCVGLSTARPFTKLGIRVEDLPSTPQASALVERIVNSFGFQAGGVPFRRLQIVVPGTRDSRLLPALNQAGFHAQPLELYRSRLPKGPLTTEIPDPQDGDAIVLTSPSAAREYVRLSLENQKLTRLKVFAFGPSTSAELQSLGIKHSVGSESAESENPWESLVRALKKEGVSDHGSN